LNNENQKTMSQKIYFGKVQIINTKTQQIQTIDRTVFKELDTPNDFGLKAKVMRGFKPGERANLKIFKICFETAKHIGETIY